MTVADVVHTSFVVERILAARPRHAFRFFSEAGRKERWNGCHPDWQVLEDTFDFSVGCGETKRWRTLEGKELGFRSHYLDIVPDSRIVYAYEMSFAGERLSASLVTIMLEAVPRGTRLVYTEQVAILSGGAEAADQRIWGTEEGLDRLVDLAGNEAVTEY